MNSSRRQFLSRSTWLGASLALKACTPRSPSTLPPSPAAGGPPPSASPVASPPAEKADYELRIGTGLVELADDQIVSTTLYNGQFPGPLSRLVEVQPLTLPVPPHPPPPHLRHS